MHSVRKWRCTFVVNLLNHIHQDTKSARLIAMCKRTFRKQQTQLVPRLSYCYHDSLTTLSRLSHLLTLDVIKWKQLKVLAIVLSTTIPLEPLSCLFLRRKKFTSLSITTQRKKNELLWAILGIVFSLIRKQVFHILRAHRFSKGGHLKWNSPIRTVLIGRLEFPCYIDKCSTHDNQSETAFHSGSYFTEIVKLIDDDNYIVMKIRKISEFPSGTRTDNLLIASETL